MRHFREIPHREKPIVFVSIFARKANLISIVGDAHPEKRLKTLATLGHSPRGVLGSMSGKFPF